MTSVVTCVITVLEPTQAAHTHALVFIHNVLLCLLIYIKFLVIFPYVYTVPDNTNYIIKKKNIIKKKKKSLQQKPLLVDRVIISSH